MAAEWTGLESGGGNGCGQGSQRESGFVCRVSLHVQDAAVGAGAGAGKVRVRGENSGEGAD